MKPLRPTSQTKLILNSIVFSGFTFPDQVGSQISAVKSGHEWQECDRGCAIDEGQAESGREQHHRVVFVANHGGDLPEEHQSHARDNAHTHLGVCGGYFIAYSIAMRQPVEKGTNIGQLNHDVDVRG